ncbi:MAG: hypothetical protein IK102_03745 [Treponema sp.]|nr:hypothetical protein [Treponema sp.]
MKKAFKLILTYFLTGILATAVGVIFYSVYLGIQKYVAGSDFVIFQKEDFLRALFYVISCVIMFICAVMTYVRISNRGSVPQFIVFVLLSAVTWAVLIPVKFKIEDKVLYNVKDSSKVLTGGYFRQDGNKVYYFTTDYNANPHINTSAIVIDTTETGQVTMESITPSRDFVLFRNSAPYSDILIKNIFDEGNLSQPVISFSLIMQHAREALAKGWTFWLGFLSIAFALASLYGAADLFRWKLLNTGFMAVATFAILCTNTLYYHPVVTSFCRQYINNQKFFVFLSRYMDYPILVLANVLAGLVFIIIGIVRCATRKKRNY